MDDLIINECDCSSFNTEKVSRIQSMIPDTQFIQRIAEFYKTLGDPTRISIISALQNEEMCVCDIANILQMSHSSISHQLKTLKAARLVKWRREGKNIFYSLDDDHIEQIVAVGIEHIKEEYK